MLLDRLVRSLAADTVAHRSHQNFGGCQERKVAIQLAIDNGRERAEFVEHREERFEQPIRGKECVWQCDPADHRTGNVALVPLVTGKFRRHRRVATQDHHEAVHAFT